MNPPEQPSECLRCWRAYCEDPSGPTLVALLKSTSSEVRTGLIVAMEQQFFRQPSWRAAQHLSMLHLDRFQPHVGTSDLVRALFFADAACKLGKDEPRARLAFARVHWERRVPAAVLHDVAIALDGAAGLNGLPEQALALFRAEAYELRALSRSYLRQPVAALEALGEAERLAGRLSLEALCALLICSWPDTPHVAEWAAERLAAHEERLATRPRAWLSQVYRARLVHLLSSRSAP